MIAIILLRSIFVVLLLPKKIKRLVVTNNSPLSIILISSWDSLRESARPECNVTPLVILTLAPPYPPLVTRTDLGSLSITLFILYIGRSSFLRIIDVVSSILLAKITLPDSKFSLNKIISFCICLTLLTCSILFSK